MPEYYDGTKILSLKDIDGNQPEVYIVTTNRTGGKTTYFNRLAMNRFIKHGEKFCLIYRYNYEVDDVADKFFKDIQSLFFKDYQMTSVRKAKGIFHELMLQKLGDEKPVSCGYAISLNSADQIKKYSHLFSDVKRMIFDELQSETNHYCPDEVKKFLSVHTSVARGQGEQVRYVPVYMLANTVSLINPYYVELGISTRLRDDTKFLRGSGFVLEQGFIESASKAQKESGVNKAFSNNSYVGYANEGLYLNDNKAFIEKPAGKGRYLATISYNGCEFAIREYADEGIIYCDDHDDETYKFKIAVTTADHQINYVMLKRNDMFINNMRFYFEKGCFRFKDLRCKEAVLKLVNYY